MFELDENATVWDTTTIGVTPTTSAQDPLLRSDNWKNETEFVIQSGDTLSAGLDRIDQSDLPLDGQYKYRWDGTGVTVFVMDTGLRMSHDEFQDRAVPPICGFDAYRNKEPDNPSCYDNHNHGTHVAGIVGGRTAGVAKNATLVAVKVIGKYGFGSDATIYAGLDYILGQKRARPKEPMVANLSLSAALDVRYNRLITKLVEAGVVVVVAAGNRRTRACLFSPSSACQAITVGASVYSSRFQRDRRAGFSNHGRCVDIFAYVRVLWSMSRLRAHRLDLLYGSFLFFAKRQAGRFDSQRQCQE